MLLLLRVCKRSSAISGVVVCEDALSELASRHGLRLTRNRRVKTRLVLHGYLAREAVSDWSCKPGGVAERVALLIERRSVRGSDRVFAVDHLLASHAKSLDPLCTPQLLLNSVDSEWFSPAGLRHELIDEFAGGRVVVLVPRRLVRKNGVSVAVEAMRFLDPVSVCMAIIGDGPMRDEAERMAHDLGLLDRSVRFFGPFSVESMPAAFRSADIVVIPSIPSHGVEEASSHSALEGLATARPVVASAIGGLGRLVETSDGGVTVAAGDAKALAQVIKRFAENPDVRESTGQKGRRYVMRSHSVEAFARQLID